MTLLYVRPPCVLHLSHSRTFSVCPPSSSRTEEASREKHIHIDIADCFTCVLYLFLPLTKEHDLVCPFSSHNTDGRHLIWILFQSCISLAYRFIWISQHNISSKLYKKRQINLKEMQVIIVCLIFTLLMLFLPFISEMSFSAFAFIVWACFLSTMSVLTCPRVLRRHMVSNAASPPSDSSSNTCVHTSQTTNKRISLHSLTPAFSSGNEILVHFTRYNNV